MITNHQKYMFSNTQQEMDVLREKAIWITEYITCIRKSK